MINYIFGVIIIVLLIFKYVQTLQARKIFTRSISFNWLVWYGKAKIRGTHSNRFRSFLIISNRITVAVWAALACWLLALLVSSVWTKI